MERNKIVGVSIVLVMFAAVITYFSLFSLESNDKIISELCEDYKDFKADVTCEEALALMVKNYSLTEIKRINPLPQLPYENRVWEITLKNGKKIIITKNKEIIKK